MIPYSQKDKKWGDIKIGHTNLVMSKDGCLIVSLSILFNTPPNVVLGLLNKAEAFTDKGMLYWSVASKVLNFIFDGIADKLPSITYLPVIAETNHFAGAGFPQHFFVMLDGKECVDPLDGKIKTNPYKIVSYRLIRKKSDLYPARPLDVEVRATIDPPPRLSFLDRITRVVRCKA